MDEMSSFSSWSYQESMDELKLKIHYTVLELEIVKAKAKEEMNRNTESVKQLLHLLKLVCHERDEARDQIQKLVINIMPLINSNPVISDCFMVDQHHLLKTNSSIAESNSHSDAYNHSSSPVDSLFDPVTSPEFPKIVNTNTCFIQDYHCNMLSSENALGSVLKIDHPTLTMETLIKGKVLPRKGNLLQSVMEAGPLLQTLLETGPAPNQMMKQSQPFAEMFCGSFLQVSVGGGRSGGVNILGFDDVNFSKCHGRMVAGGPMASNFGLVEKRQRLQ